MPFDNACFISYRHAGPAMPIVRQFCHELSVQLAWISNNLPLFRDEKRLKPGDYLDRELAVQMCRSTCMVLLFTPDYFDLAHPYCAREYWAMLDLEARRKEALPAELQTKSLVIPVVIRGEDRLPEELKKNLCASFDKTLLQASNLRRQVNQERLRTVAEAIYERMEGMRAAQHDLAQDCASFDFPTEEAIRERLSAFARRPLGNPTREQL